MGTLDKEIKIIMLKGEKGNSSYEEAVENGLFSGTLEEWIETYATPENYVTTIDFERVTQEQSGNISDLQEDVSDLKNDVYDETTGLKNRVSINENNINDLQNDVLGLQNNVSSLNDVIYDETTGLKNRVSINENDINNLQENVSNLEQDISSLGTLEPSGTDTSTNILDFNENKGIYVGTDNGHWYYWNGTEYTDGGVYQATQLSAGDRAKIDNSYGPAYVGEDTSTNILAKSSNTGIWKASDNNHWYYWNGTQYVNGGVYQTTQIPDNSITNEKLVDNTLKPNKLYYFNRKSYSLIDFSELEGISYHWTAYKDFIINGETNTQYTLTLYSTFVSSSASSNLVLQALFYYDDNTTSAKTIMGSTSVNSYQKFVSTANKTITKIRIQAGNDLYAKLDKIMLVKGLTEMPYQNYFNGNFSDYLKLGYKINENDTNFFEYGKYNLYQPTNQIDNYYYYTDGAITYNTNFWYDDTFFDIEPSTQYISNCIICEYDENYNFLARHGDSIAFTTNANAKMFRISGLKARKDIAIFRKGSITITSIDTANVKNANLLDFKSIDTTDLIIRKRIDITTNDNFVDKMKEAFNTKNCDVYIASGVYDISNTNVYTSSPIGIPIGNNCKYYFATNSKVICNYTGDDTSIMNTFSLLFTTYTYGDFELHNFNCETSRIRYAIHDECGSLTTAVYRHIYNNCMIKHDNTNHPNKANYFHCIGGGLGYSGEIIITNCCFNSVYTTNGDISYHANSNGSASVSNDSICKLTVSSSYFEHTISLSVSGVANKQIAMISNNSFASALYYNGTGTENKWQTYAWNNEIRN